MSNQESTKYRIRDLSTGLYLSRGWSISSGLFSPHWSQEGRVWKKLGTVKRILSMMKKRGIEPSFLWIVEATVDGQEEKFSVLTLCDKNVLETKSN